MTRAEKAALKAYPKEDGKIWTSAFGTFEFDKNAPERKAFQEGYEQAEKDTIERAVTWLKDNANKYIVDLTETYPDAPVNIIVGGKCWEDLKEYIEKEQA